MVGALALVTLLASTPGSYEQSLGSAGSVEMANATERAVAEGLKKARPTALPDDRLSAACREFLEGKVFTPSPVVGAADFDVFRFLLWRQGVGDTVLLPYRGRFENEAKARAAMKNVIAQLVATPFNRWGVAATVDAKKHVDVAIVVAQRDVGFTAIPRVVEPGAAIETTITTASAREVRVLVQEPEGSTAEHAIGKVEGTSSPVTLVFGDQPGRYDVEIVFVEPAGPYITASFPVHAGEPLPERFVAPTYAPEAGKLPEAEIEKRLAKLVNDTRSRYKLPPLRLDATLGRIAREHSLQMKKAGFGRSTMEHGPLTTRLTRAKVWYRDATEVIGAGVSAAAIHASLMSSPAHRLVLLDSRLTDLGVGVAIVKPASGVPQIYATEVLATLVPKVDVAQAQKKLLARINEKRVAEGLPPLAADPALANVATRHAIAMAADGEPAYEIPGKPAGTTAGKTGGKTAAGTKPASLFDAAKAAMPSAKALGGFVGVLETLDDPIEFEGVLEREMTKAGIGITQASSDEYGAGALWIAVVVAR